MIAMTDTDIRVFLCVAKQLNFSRAAEELFLTRQAVSKQIGKLEQQLGGPLFVRGSGGLAFTESGRTYYEFFQRTMQEFDEIGRRLSHSAEAVKPIQVGYVPGCAAALNQIISLVQFCQSHDHLQFNLVCCEPMDMQSMLEHGALDVAINFDLQGAHGSALTAMPFISSPRLLLVSRLHPRASTARSYEEFQSDSLLGWRRSNETMEDAAVNLRKNSGQYGFRAKEIRILPNLESANTALRLNEGVALGTRFNTISASPDLAAFPLNQNVELLLIWRKNEMDPGILRFVKNVKTQKLPLLI